VPTAPAVRVQQKSTRQNHRYEPDHPAFPAQWLYGVYALSSGTGFLAPVVRCSSKRITNFAPAPGRQDHTIWPCASCCSSAWTSMLQPDTPTASRAQRPWRSRYAPLTEAGRRDDMHDFWKKESEIFEPASSKPATGLNSLVKRDLRRGSFQRRNRASIGVREQPIAHLHPWSPAGDSPVGQGVHGSFRGRL